MKNMGGLVDALRSHGFSVANDVRTLREYSHDASIFEVVPQVVVYPQSVEDVGRLVMFVNERSPKVWLTPRGGGTDMTGGAIGESIVVDTTKYLNRILEVTDIFATAQGGTKYLAFEEATLARDRIMPSYPASRALVTVGGMVANNAGGEKSLAYGQTKDYVRSVKVVLRDGNEYLFGPLDRQQLNAKLGQQNLEGQIYRDIYWMLEEHRELIRRAKPGVSKNSSGYLLWEVWESDEGSREGASTEIVSGKKFNLAKLICGSQGTLGFITEVTLGLVPVKPHTGMLVVFLKDLSQVADVTHALLKHGPEELESFDDKTLQFTSRFLPDFLRVLGAQNIFKLAWQFLPDVWTIMTMGGFPKIVLLCEFAAHERSEVSQKLDAAAADMERMGVRTRIARTEEEAKKYWTIRRESFNVLRHHSTEKKTVPFVDDVIVPLEKMSVFLPKLLAILERYPKMTLTIAGHAGNGNFHVIPLMDLSRPDARPVIEEVSKQVYDLVLSYGGSITAEHNDGLVRGPYVEQMFGAEVYGLFRKVKDIFDPDGIFNPGKKIDVDWEWAMAHMRKD